MKARILAILCVAALLHSEPAPGQEPPVEAPAPGGVNVGYALTTESETEGSFRARGMEIGDALRLLLVDEGVSLILGPDVSGTVDLELDRAPTAEILDLLGRIYGFAYEFRGDILLIESQETRRFALELIQTFDVELPGGDLREEWQQIRTSLEQLKSQSGSLSIHELSGVITARDDPRVLDQMEVFIDGIRERLARQVQIEARIVEVSLDKSFETGIDWSALSDVLAGDFQGSLIPDGSVARQRTVTGDGVFKLGILKPGKVDLLLDALAERTDFRVVARPRVVSAANRPATIQVTEMVPYLTKQVSREGGVAFTDFQVEFEEAGVQMVVTAQPSPTGPISMAIHPIISNVTGYTPSLPDLGPQPIVDVRETRTSLAVRDRETLVLSGLIQERKIRKTRGIPLLADIPILGYLFRHTSDAVQRVELVVLLTPTLLENRASGEVLRIDRMRLLEQEIDILDPDLGRRSYRPLTKGERLRASLAARRSQAALAAYRSGDPAAAVVLCRRALELFPRNLMLRSNLGLFLRDAGRLDEAETILRRVLTEEPGVSGARSNLALLLLEAGRTEEARELLNEGLQIETDPSQRKHLEANLALCRQIGESKPQDEPEPQAPGESLGSLSIDPIDR